MEPKYQTISNIRVFITDFKKICNIFIAQISYEYDEMRVTNIIQIKHNKLRIPTGGRLTSWLFTRRGGVEFGPPKTSLSSGKEEDLNPGPPDYKSSALPLGHARLPHLSVHLIGLS